MEESKITRCPVTFRQHISQFLDFVSPFRIRIHEVDFILSNLGEKHDVLQASTTAGREVIVDAADGTKCVLAVRHSIVDSAAFCARAKPTDDTLDIASSKYLAIARENACSYFMLRSVTERILSCLQSNAHQALDFSIMEPSICAFLCVFHAPIIPVERRFDYKNIYTI